MKPKHFAALGVLFASVTITALLAAAQKPMPAQPTEQQKLKERVDTLDSQLKEAQAKADRAAMEKDYVERIQKEVNAYYEKAFNTQLAVITIIGLIVGLIGKFGADHIVQSKLTEATTQLERKFNEKLAAELKTLKESNAAQMKQLEADLENRVSRLEGSLTRHVKYTFFVAQGQAAAADERHEDALDSFRWALKTYKSSKRDDLFTSANGGRVIRNILVAIQHLHPDNPLEEARKELAGELYKDLGDEVAHGAGGFEWSSSLVAERILARPSVQETYHPTTEAASATPKESRSPAPDKAQTTKPQERNNK